MHLTRLVGAMVVVGAAVVPAMVVAYQDGRDAGAVQRAPGGQDAGAGPRAGGSLSPPHGVPREASAPPFAVVELFTSEGCSSCPPAEALANEMADEAAEAAEGSDGRRVFVLAFHVDYWDRLGWKDPYAAAAYSERQRAYAGAFKERSVYTPQMIVNGREGFVGSDRVKAGAAVEAALARPARASVSARALARKGDAPVMVEYDVSGAPAGAVLNAALVVRGLTSAVKRGENAGRTLRHENVVRAFASVKAEGTSGRVELAVPEGVDRTRASVILYLQDSGTMEVVGAGVVDLP